MPELCVFIYWQVQPGHAYQARIAPNYLNVYVNLANLISKNASRLEEADTLYRQAISMRSDLTQALINRGDVLLRMNRTLDAHASYKTALRYDNDNPDIYYNLAVVLVELNQHFEALEYFEKALAFDPDHRQSLMNSAILIQELGREDLRPLGYNRLFRLLEFEPDNEKIYFNLGILATDDGDYEKAENWFKKAIGIKEDFRSALFNLALMLATDIQRPLEAVPYLLKLLKHYPDHHKALILLGDIYLNNLHDVEAAEKCFEKVIQSDEEHVQGRHNLCVIYVEQGNLLRAERCLVEVAKLAPHEEYIRSHLNIVRARILEHQQNQVSIHSKSNGAKIADTLGENVGAESSDQFPEVRRNSVKVEL